MRMQELTITLDGKPVNVKTDGQPHQDLPEGFDYTHAVEVTSLPLPFHKKLGRVYRNTKGQELLEVYASGSFFPYYLYLI